MMFRVKSMNLKFLPVWLLLMFIIPLIPAEAHLSHLPHYNGGSELSEGYIFAMAVDPEYVRPGEKSTLLISIQDTNGNDLQGVKAEVKILKDEEVVSDFPLAVHPTGDFTESYTFAEPGIYEVEVDAYGSKESPYSGGTPEGSVTFDVFVSNWSGPVFIVVKGAAMVIPLALLGAVLAFRTNAIRRKGRLEKDTLFQYVAVLAAIAAGSMHIMLFSDHSSESIFYGVFFLVAGSSQLTYGTLYMLLKSKALNYFGLVGTLAIIGLYIYSVILPPPLHPSPVPEQVEIIGIIVKTMESVLLVALIYIIIKSRRHGLQLASV